MFPISAQSGSKPRPPRNLRYISEDFRILEVSHSEDKFDEALESIERMKIRLEEISGEINSAGAGNTLSTLMSYLTDYEKILRNNQRETDECEEARIDMSIALFKIMDAFSYRIPPMLDFINRQLDELKEEVLEDGEWDEAADEVEEIEEFLPSVTDNYSAVKGVSSLAEEVEKKMEELENAIKRENASNVVDSVQEIKSLIEQISDLVVNQ